MIGQRFCRLVVIALIPDQKNPKARCLCDCGAIVEPQRGALRNGRAKSCGCLRREILANYSESQRLPEGEARRRRVACAKAWADKNPERHREINRLATRRFYRKHPDAAKRNCQNRRARLAGLMGSVSAGIEASLAKKQRGLCACCRAKLLGSTSHLDHVMPLALGGKHEDENLQLLCATCNLSKGAKHPIAFMQSKGRLL